MLICSMWVKILHVYSNSISDIHHLQNCKLSSFIFDIYLKLILLAIYILAINYDTICHKNIVTMLVDDRQKARLTPVHFVYATIQTILIK